MKSMTVTARKGFRRLYAKSMSICVHKSRGEGRITKSKATCLTSCGNWQAVHGHESDRDASVVDAVYAAQASIFIPLDVLFLFPGRSSAGDLVRGCHRVHRGMAICLGNFRY